MAIQELRIDGFRSFRDVAWRPSSLNLVVGPNASGKSNLLSALRFISEAARGRLAETVADAGGMVPLLWNQSVDRMRLHATLDPVDADRDPVADAVTYEIELRQLGKGSAYQISGDSLGNWVKYERKEDPTPRWILHRANGRAAVYDQRVDKLVEIPRFHENESLLSQVTDQLVNPIPALAGEAIRRWRIHDDVNAARGSRLRRPVTTQYTFEIEHDGSNLANVMHSLYTLDRGFETRIDEGMIAAFGPEYDKVTFQPAASQQVQLAVRWKSSLQPHAASELSDGTLRYLFLLTVLANPNPPSVIAIDEPETGLHPNMLPLVADYAAAAAERTQVIMTSHSPEFLDVFTEDMSPTVTVCHWEEGETRLYPLATETLKPWLERYRLGEMFTRGDVDGMTLPDIARSDDELDACVGGLPAEDVAPPRDT